MNAVLLLHLKYSDLRPRKNRYGEVDPDKGSCLQGFLSLIDIFTLVLTGIYIGSLVDAGQKDFKMGWLDYVPWLVPTVVVCVYLAAVAGWYLTWSYESSAKHYHEEVMRMRAERRD